jgi:hypothetical protein
LEKKGGSLEDYEPEDLGHFFELLFVLLPDVWGAESLLPLGEYKFKNIFLTS